MKITVLTLFPGMFDGFLNESIIKRAIGKNLVEIELVNFRDFTTDKYGRVDTPPIGGGAGLVLKLQPLVAALKSSKNEHSHTVLLSPRGEKYSQKKATQFASLDHLILIAGHYEGIDERFNDYVDESISLGDYVLTGGEVPAMAIIDSIVRLVDEVIEKTSLEEESFSEGLLEYPQYTEPYEFEGKKVPDILYSGHHGAIKKWRRKQALKLTKTHRPDLFEKFNLSKEDLRLLKEDSEQTPKWEKSALDNGNKFIKK